MFGNLHWIGVGFSMVAYVLQNMHQVSSNREDCILLLEKIVDLAKILQKLSKRMPDEKQKLERAVHTIVEGAIICCCYSQERTIFRFFTAQTVGETLKDTRANLNNLISELGLLVTMDIQAQQPHPLEQPRNILQISEPVGMEKPFEEVKGLLDTESSGRAKAVIIYRFGGSLAEYVVSNLALDGFKLCVIRIDKINLDIKKLQEQILFDVRGETIKLRNFEEGQSKVKDALKDRFCFLVIDNIVDKDDLRHLLPQEFSLPSKTRILLTSRKNDVREVLPHTIECREYLVEGLPSEKSVQLLRQKVFNNNVQHETCDDEERMIKDIAEACGGVPLPSTIFGEHLRVYRSKQAYEEALRSLKEGERGRYVEEGLGEKLLYAYHKMKNQDAKEAFLDICIFFHGWRKGRVSFIVGEDELKLLQEGALVKITESNEVIVHDVLRSLGIKEGKDTRLRLQSTADLLSALDDDEEEKALEKIKGIWFDSGNTSQIFSLESKHLNKMCKSLKALSLGDGIVLEGQCQGRKFKHLRFLQAVSKLELDGLPQTLKELRILRPLPYHKRFVVHPSWSRHIKYLTNLAVLELSTLMSIKFPQDFVLPASLRELDLIYCEDLENLPQGFGQLTSLTDLTLKGCCGLSTLPTDFGGLRSLKRLNIRRCEKLTELPQGFGQLTSLTDLRLRGCHGLHTLDFGGLCSLERLCIYWCGGLTDCLKGWGISELEETAQ